VYHLSSVLTTIFSIGDVGSENASWAERVSEEEYRVSTPEFHGHASEYVTANGVTVSRKELQVRLFIQRRSPVLYAQLFEPGWVYGVALVRNPDWGSVVAGLQAKMDEQEAKVAEQEAKVADLEKQLKVVKEDVESKGALLFQFVLHLYRTSCVEFAVSVFSDNRVALVSDCVAVKQLVARLGIVLVVGPIGCMDLAFLQRALKGLTSLDCRGSIVVISDTGSELWACTNNLHFRKPAESEVVKSQYKT